MFQGTFCFIFCNTSCEILNLDAFLDLLVVENDRQKSFTSPLHALVNKEISMVAELSEILSQSRAAANSWLSIILQRAVRLILRAGVALWISLSSNSVQDEDALLLRCAIDKDSSSDSSTELTSISSKV